ncbi:MAG TPA: hypothetical protein DCS93_15285 [Microscillaceae bacterium]|nr:hypothetical protein [Microscillaceae bacterium]
MKSHSVQYKIIGDFTQILEVNLEPQKTIITDAAFLLYIDEEVHFEQRNTDGADEVEEEIDEEEELEEIEEDEGLEQEDLEDEFGQMPPGMGLEPDMEGLDDSIMGDLDEEEELDEAFESEEEIDPSKGNLLGKLWTATRKKVQSIKVGRGGDDKEDEEELLPEGFDPSSIGGSEEEFESDGPPEFGEEPIPEMEEEEEEPPPQHIFTHLSNESDFIRTVALAPTQPCHVLDINLGELEDQAIHICKGSFIAAAKGTEVTTFAETDILLRPQDEEGLVIERLAGDGMAFIKAKGDVIERILEDDAIRVNLASVVAYEPSIELDMQSILSLESLNAENPVIMALFSGSGMLWLQSNQMPPQVIQNITQAAEATSEPTPADLPPMMPPMDLDDDSDESPELDLPDLDGEIPLMDLDLPEDEEELPADDKSSEGPKGELKDDDDDEMDDILPPELRELTKGDDD